MALKDAGSHTASMILLLLAVLPSVVAIVLLAALGLAVLWRTVRGERWQVPLEGVEDEKHAIILSDDLRTRAPTPQVLVQNMAVPSAS